MSASGRDELCPYIPNGGHSLPLLRTPTEKCRQLDPGVEKLPADLHYALPQTDQGFDVVLARLK